MSRNQRLSFLGIAAVIAVIAIAVFATSGGSDDGAQDAGSTASQRTVTPTATPTAAQSGDGDGRAEPTATPVPEPKPPLLVAGKTIRLRAAEGETVRFRVRSDEAEEVHVHGYDIKKDLEPGRTATITFKASITGIFEIEFERSAEQIAELRVDPR